MFTFREAGYQFARNKGRTALLILVSMLLCGCIAFYIGNITSSRAALETINETTPAIVRISNCYGDQVDDLTISYVRYDHLEPWMDKVFVTSQLRGALEEGTEYYPFTIEYNTIGDYSYISNMKDDPGDTALLAVSCMEAAGIDSDKRFTYASGRDGSIMEGDEGLCVVSGSYAEKHGLAIGNKIAMPVCLVPYDTGGGHSYTEAVDVEMEIAGTFDPMLKAEYAADIYLPVRWLRAECEAKAPYHGGFSDNSGILFNYNTYYAYLADSMDLNTFKDQVKEMGFYQPFYLEQEGIIAPDASAGSSIMMDDEDFIDTAEKLGSTIRQYEAFLIPFFLVVAGLVTLAIFLVLRGAQRDMAVACSLGRPKKLIGAANLLAALAAEALGCVAAVPVMIAAAGLSFVEALGISGTFILCALIGDVIGLAALLRFDALSLLTKAD